jgi:hypothetical protein
MYDLSSGGYIFGHATDTFPKPPGHLCCIAAYIVKMWISRAIGFATLHKGVVTENDGKE